MTDPYHLDMFGQPVYTGDFVVAVYGTTIRPFKVNTVSPKTLGIESLDNVRKQVKYNKYPKEVTKIEPELITIYMMKK